VATLTCVGALIVVPSAMAAATPGTDDTPNGSKGTGVVTRTPAATKPPPALAQTLAPAAERTPAPPVAKTPGPAANRTGPPAAKAPAPAPKAPPPAAERPAPAAKPTTPAAKPPNPTPNPPAAATKALGSAAKKTPAPAAQTPAAANKTPAPAGKTPAPGSSTVATASPASAAPAAANPDPQPTSSPIVSATAQPATATPTAPATPDPSPVVDVVATPAEAPPAVGVADEIFASSPGVRAATSQAPSALARAPASSFAVTPATPHATTTMALQVPRHQGPSTPSTILARPSRAVALQSTHGAAAQVPGPRSQHSGAQAPLPLAPSGTASAASAAGAPGITSSLLWCVILVSLLLYCAQELRRHRIRVLPDRSVLAVSLHPRPG
jgi:hypothetical protein